MMWWTFKVEYSHALLFFTGASFGLARKWTSPPNPEVQQELDQ